MRPLILLIAALMGVHTTFLAAAERYASLGPLPVGDENSNPQRIVATANAIYFTTYDGTARHLWHSDGTEEGTHEVPTLHPLRADHPTLEPDPLFAGVDGLLYYVTRESEGASTRYYVECTDGTPAGTKELFSWLRSDAGNANAHFVNHTFTDGVTSRQGVVFAGGEPSRLDELTGGVVANAVSNSPTLITSLSSVQVGSEHFLYSTVGNRYNESFGATLSLGEQFGTAMPDCVHHLTGNQILYVHQAPRWIRVIDRVTKVVKSFSTDAKAIIPCGGRLFFLDGSNNTLWTVDAGATPTEATISQIDPYPVATAVPVNSSFGTDLIAASGNTLFAVRIDTAHGSELWKIDQSKEASLVTDLTMGPSGTTFLAIAPFGSGVVFLIKTQDGFLELWKSNGTEAGTKIIRRMNCSDMQQGEIATQGTRFFFTGQDLYGREPWISDGTTAGTRMVKNLVQTPLTPAFAGIRTYYGFATTGTETFFTAQANANLYMIKSDGTADGTKNLGLVGVPPMTISPSGSVLPPPRNVRMSSVDVPGGTHLMLSTPLDADDTDMWYEIRDRLFYYDFASKEARDLGTWSRPFELLPVASYSVNYEMTLLGNALLFSDAAPDGDYALWKSNGYLNGTFRFAPSEVELLGQIGSVQYFAASDETSGRELWRTNGLPEGTRMVKDIVPGSGDAFPMLWIRYGGKADAAVLGNFLYFGASTPATGYELWRTNGADAGTVQIKEINPGAIDSSPAGFAVVGQKMIFAATDAEVGRELFVSDGTSAGTRLLKDLSAGWNSSSPVFFCQKNGIAYYRAMTAAEGMELWRTDGTEAGTFMLGDLGPGFNSTIPSLRGMTSNRVFFVVNHANLYSTDGTVEGTRRLGNVSTSLTDADVVNNAFYFISDWNLHRSDGTPEGTAVIEGLPECLYLEGHAGAKIIFYGSLNGGPDELFAYDTRIDTAAQRWEKFK